MERSNLHHVFWQRRAYKTSLEKRLRNSLVIPALVSAHAELHHDMAPPHKPSRDLTFEMLDHIDPHEAPMDNLLNTIEVLSDIPTGEAQRLTGHLVRQLGYLTLEKV